MTSLPLTRDEALNLIHKYNKDKSDINHYLESEAIMGALANRLGEDIEYWRMLGLLHDIDWGITKHDLRKHLTEMPRILREAGFDDYFRKPMSLETILKSAEEAFSKIDRWSRR